MSTIRKSIISASAATLVLGLSVAATATPAAAAGPLGWTYDIATGTYENMHPQAHKMKSSKKGNSTQVATNFTKLDPTSKLAYNNPEG